MLSILFLILISCLFAVHLNKVLHKNFLKLKNNYNSLFASYENLRDENAESERDNLILENTAVETMALYDITKEICKYLDEDKIFACFKEVLSKHIRVSDCRFLKADANLENYSDYLIMPFRLKSESHPVGYLAASGIEKEEKDKFSILANQFILGIKKAMLYKRVQELAITDSLTGIFSRRYYLERFQEELERSKKFGYNFAFLMIDIDNFKDYNDRFGHLVGDTILRELAKILKENIRQIDLIGRYGGEEFSIIFTETGKQEAAFVAERIREAVENKSIRAYDEDLKVTISIGISIYPADAQETGQLIEKADEALYRAKLTGKNKVCIYEG
ncbi:MAG: GGDEF domain-containing protein [Candidatus Omnitrophica bacterium]|jgi:diguanylate cyclase (GGDEF)-like protein|nr:GGDEF domain-containing protein [Candidatus Omnitrophota bacterium]